MTTYHLDLGDGRTEALDSVTKLTLVGTPVDIDTYAVGDFKSPVPLWGSVVLTRGEQRHPATTRWAEDVENTDTHQDIVLIADGRRIRLAGAYASTTYHLDEDDDPDAFAISFTDITTDK
ncbi:hypothetical protein [Streptomyces sp. NPDC006925]|uniref:hypothetical protein n=1 Tax=Streptomyces sp. NPDC006925 TaxID=3364768 RepID=UPI0036792146